MGEWGCGSQNKGEKEGGDEKFYLHSTLGFFSLRICLSFYIAHTAEEFGAFNRGGVSVRKCAQLVTSFALNVVVFQLVLLIVCLICFVFV